MPARTSSEGVAGCWAKIVLHFTKSPCNFRNFADALAPRLVPGCILAGNL
jgi:hypothetical protein